MERDFTEETKQSLISEIRNEMVQLNIYVVEELDGWNNYIAPKMVSELQGMGIPIQDDVPSREIGQVVWEIFAEEKRRIDKIEQIWQNVNSLDTSYAAKLALLQEEANVLSQQMSQITDLLSKDALSTFDQLPEYFDRICSSIDSNIKNSGFLAQVQLERNKMQNPDKTYNWEYVTELMNAGNKITEAQLTALSGLYFTLDSPEDIEEYIKCGYAWVTEINKDTGDVTYSIEMTSVMQAVIVLATETASQAAELTVFDPRIPESSYDVDKISDAMARTTVLQHLLEYQSKIPVSSNYFEVVEIVKGFDPPIAYDYPVQIEESNGVYTVTYAKAYPFRYDITEDGFFGLVQKQTTEVMCYGLLNSAQIDGVTVNEAFAVTEFFRPNTNGTKYAVNETAGWLLEEFGGNIIEAGLLILGVATGPAGLAASIAYSGGEAVISYVGQLSADQELNNYLDQVNNGFAIRYGIILLDGYITFSSTDGGIGYYRAYLPGRNYYLRTQGFLNSHSGLTSDELNEIIFNNAIYGTGNQAQYEKAIDEVKNNKNLSDAEKTAKTQQMEYEYGVYKEYVDYYERDGYKGFENTLRDKYKAHYRDFDSSAPDAEFEELTYDELLALSRIP